MLEGDPIIRGEFMERRAFVKRLFVVSAVGSAFPLAAVGRAQDCDATGIKSFGYYEGLSPDGTRSASRTDGTYYNMPCIPAADVELGEEKSYEFWHGHSRDHEFTVTAEDFERLKAGESIEIHTNVVDGHRHALRISPEESCEA